MRDTVTGSSWKGAYCGLPKEQVCRKTNSCLTTAVSWKWFGVPRLSTGHWLHSGSPCIAWHHIFFSLSSLLSFRLFDFCVLWFTCLFLIWVSLALRLQTWLHIETTCTRVPDSVTHAVSVALSLSPPPSGLFGKSATGWHRSNSILCVTSSSFTVS